MPEESSAILARLTEASLRKCLTRLSKVSAGTWDMRGTSSFRGTLEDALKRHDFKNPTASVVYIKIRELPLTAVIMFDPRDMECISKCFMGYSFPGGPVTTQAEEMMLLELGNIILNFLINFVLNALRKSALPSVPAYLEGDTRRLLEGLGAGAVQNTNFHITAATLALASGKSEARCEVLALVPEGLALEFPAPVK